MISGFYHYKLDIQTVKEIKEEIDHVVATRSTLVDPSVYDISTKNGDQYHLNFDLVGSYPKAERTLRDIVSDCCGKTNLHVANAWTIYGKKGGWHSIHNHADNSSDDICTVTYLDVGEETVSEGGNFFFFMGDTHRPRTFTPTTGDVVIFPAWMYHGTYPQSSDMRQTLNIDFYYEESILK